MSSGPPANKPSNKTATYPARGAPPDRQHWMLQHACPFCTYTHRVGFRAAPSARVEYQYRCPYTGKDVRFSVLNTMLPESPSEFGVVFASAAE